MQNILNISSRNNISLWLFFLILGGYVFAALFAFNFIGLLCVLPFFDFDINLVTRTMSNPVLFPESKIPLLLIQGIVSFGSFILAPWFVISRYLKIPINNFFSLPKDFKVPILLTIVITFTFMVINSVAIDWNQNIIFPESLSWFESHVKAKETQLKILTTFITEFNGIGHLLLGLVVIAIIPAFGEELLFRGLIQNIFRTSINPHLAIWFTALLFAAFHYQFYGLVPRMLLGALFGYMYLWSGHLMLPVISHFVNNGFMILMIFLHDRGITEYDLESADALPNNYILLLFFVINVGLMVVLYRFFNSTENG